MTRQNIRDALRPGQRGPRIELAWLVLVWAIAVAAIWIAATIIGSSIPVPRGGVPFPRSAVEVLSSWDGENYRDIAEYGYKANDNLGLFAFFPLLPLIARLLGGSANAPLAGILVSQLCFLACMLLLSKFKPDEGAPGLLRQPGFWLLISPVGFFFLAFYTESLFLLLTLLMALACRRQKLLAGTLSGLLAGLTRPSALVLPLLFAQSVHRNRGDVPKLWRLFLAATAPLIGFALYLGFVGCSVGDPLGYFRIQKEVFGRFGSGQLTFPFAGDVVELRLLRDYVEARTFPPMDIPVSLGSTAFVIVAIALWWKRLELSLLPFTVGGLLFIHSVTSQASSARYELMLFPAFIGVAGLASQRPRLAFVAATLSIGLQAALFHKFALWEFVA